MKLSKEVKTALLAIISIALLVFGYNYLKGKNLLTKDLTLYVVYDNVEGLDMSSPVTINGLKVGSVQKISFSDKAGKLLVQFNVEGDFEFSKNSVARVYGGFPLGSKSLAIIPDFEGEPAESGDVLRGEVENGVMELITEQLSPLQQKFEHTIVSADSLLTAVNDVMDTDTRASLRATLAHLNQTAVSFKNASARLDKILSENDESLSRSLSNLDTLTQNFAGFSESLAEVDIKATIDNLENTLADINRITEQLNSGEGNIGKLLHDEQLYENLEGASKQLELLLEDMKNNPKRYVHFSLFGRKHVPYEGNR